MIKRISTEMNPDNIARVLAQLANTPDALEAACAGRNEEQLRIPIGPGERSTAEIIAHLINTEWVSTESIVLAILITVPMLPKIHAERGYATVMRHTMMPVAESLAYFRYRRAVMMPLLQSLTDKQWARQVRVKGKQRQESVYWLARGMAVHEAEHLAWLAERLVPTG